MPRGPETEPDAILGTVTVIPRLFKNVVYDALVDRMKRVPDSKTVGFAYDWRMDPYVAVASLAQTVELLKDEGIQKIDVVAHSGGGLILAYYLGYGSQSPDSAELNWAGAKNIHKAVFLGTPFRGGLMMFENFFRGVDRPLIRDMFPPEVILSYPANYSAMPTDPVRFYSWSGKAWEMDLRDLDFWKAGKLGLLANQHLPIQLQNNRLRFLKEQLNNGGLFMRLVQYSRPEVEPAPPFKVLSVRGHGFSTPEAVYFRNVDCQMELTFASDRLSKLGLSRERLMADGDGLVTMRSSELPEALAGRAEFISTEADHKALATDANIADQVIAFLLRD